MKLLVDECLSPELIKLAHEKGYGQSSHVVWMNRGGSKDWELKRLILEGDWTFVTRNAVDFRGPADDPGSKGQYAGVALHAGLICLNGRLAWIWTCRSSCSMRPWMNSLEAPTS